MSTEQKIRDEQFRNVTGAYARFQAIEGVGKKTADKLRRTRGVSAPTDAADFTADELAQRANISKSRAEKVIRAGGGRPDMAEGKQRSNRSVSAGGLADAMDEQTREAGAVVQQRRDLFGDLVQLGEKVPDRRKRRRGDFGPFEGEDPERVREIGRAADTFRRATNNPIDPTEQPQSFGFDRETARKQAATVSSAATEYLERDRGVKFEKARSEVTGKQPDFGTVESVVGQLVTGSQTNRQRKKSDKELLQEVEGIGPKRSENLLSKFGSGEKVERAATSAWGRIADTEGVSKDTAREMFDRMNEAGVREELKNRFRYSNMVQGSVRTTDIGRESDGEFARPESNPDITPAPIARNNRNGEFGLDPYDITLSMR